MNEPKNPKVIKLNPKTARNKKSRTAKLNPPKKTGLKISEHACSSDGAMEEGCNDFQPRVLNP